MRIYDFGNGKSASLAEWENLRPVEHGSELFDRAWSAADGRAGLSFYPSTEEYMRNTWAFSNLENRIVYETPRRATMLFKSPETGTWHTIDGFDIDHIVPAVDHATNLGADNVAEATIAYNDVNNLRLLPSALNRAGFLNEGLGDGIPMGWIDEAFGFDAGAGPAVFRPANRRLATYGKSWSLQNDGRGSLSFDQGVQNAWRQNRLREIQAATAEIDGQQVPLFRCEATGQLVTKDTLDIDHRVPVESLLRNVRNKGDALDIYNDTSNLRLVARGPNASHEWELGPDGLYRDRDEASSGKRRRGQQSLQQGADESADDDAEESLASELDAGISDIIQAHFAAAPVPQPPPSGQPVRFLGHFGNGRKKIRQPSIDADDAAPAADAGSAGSAADAASASAAAGSDSAGTFAAVAADAAEAGELAVFLV